MTKNVEIWHNILWSSYKAQVFTELSRVLVDMGINGSFFQIAESDSQRVDLSSVDFSAHQYPFKLLFKGRYDDINLASLILRIAKIEFSQPASVILMAGYNRPEHWAQLLFNKIQGRKVAVFCDSTAYDNKASYAKSIAKRFFFARCDRILCYGERAREYIESFGVRSQKIAYRCQTAKLPNGYDASEIVKKRVDAFNPGVVRFLYVGRLSAEKRIDTLIQAFDRYAQTGSDVELIIVGSGPQEMDLKRLASTLQCSLQVTFAGSKAGSDLYDEYLRATAMVLPSHSEPWGLVVNEALAFGCPVVVSHRCGCVPELVIDGVSGFVFECDDVSDLLLKLENVAKLAEDTARTAEACLDVIEPFNPKNSAAQIATVLLSLI